MCPSNCYCKMQHIFSNWSPYHILWIDKFILFIVDLIVLWNSFFIIYDHVKYKSKNTLYKVISILDRFMCRRSLRFWSFLGHYSFSHILALSFLAALPRISYQSKNKSLIALPYCTDHVPLLCIRFVCFSFGLSIFV